MDEYSRIVIEQYCKTHHSNRSARIARLLEMSYSIDAFGTDGDALFLEQAIERERNPELREALEDLDDFLFGW